MFFLFRRSVLLAERAKVSKVVEMEKEAKGTTSRVKKALVRGKAKVRRLNDSEVADEQGRVRLRNK